MPNRRGLAEGVGRRDFLRLAGMSVAALGTMSLAERLLFSEDKPRKPNIVFVFADQHRNCSWPGGGDPQVKMPNLETLAKDGVTFNHCISNHPLCSPYRASLLTGRYQQATGIANNVGNGEGLRPTEVTIADVLKKAGYATGYVGKWHLYPRAQQGAVVPPGPHRHGFDWWRISYNFRQRYNTYYLDDDGKKVVLPDYAPKCQMGQVMEFVEKNADRPFCVFLSWHPPHPPYKEAPKQFADLYTADGIKLRGNVPKADDTPRRRENHVEYFAHVSAMDEEIGRLMKKLAALGIADNTIVCYSSDHGDMLGSFGLRNKNKPWEESINVPFVIRWPGGVPGGRRLDTLFSTVDIAPTLLGLAGVEVLPQMQGTDVSGILRGKQGPEPESAFIMGDMKSAAAEEEEDAQADDARAQRLKTKGAAGEWRGVRTRRHTFVRYGGRRGAQEPWLLYDNEKDPLQTHNLIDDAGSAETRKELDAMLGKWLKQVGEA
jgi:arylsulfatase A-like enzyme